jgi:hypothetical protein
LLCKCPCIRLTHKIMTTIVSIVITAGIIAFSQTSFVQASETEPSPQMMKLTGDAHDHNHNSDKHNHMAEAIVHLEDAIIHAEAGHTSAAIRHTQKAMDRMNELEH